MNICCPSFYNNDRVSLLYTHITGIWSGLWTIQKGSTHVLPPSKSWRAKSVHLNRLHAYGYYLMFLVPTASPVCVGTKCAWELKQVSPAATCRAPRNNWGAPAWGRSLCNRNRVWQRCRWKEGTSELKTRERQNLGVFPERAQQSHATQGLITLT